jgi:hypothetical protein
MTGLSVELPPIYRASTSIGFGGHIWWCRLGLRHGPSYYRRYVEGYRYDGSFRQEDWVNFHFTADQATVFMQYIPSTRHVSCSVAPLTRAVNPALIELVYIMPTSCIELVAEDDNYSLDFDVVGFEFAAKAQLN